MATPRYEHSTNGTTDSPLSSGSRGISDIFAIQLEVTGRLLEAEQNKVSWIILIHSGLLIVKDFSPAYYEQALWSRFNNIHRVCI